MITKTSKEHPLDTRIIAKVSLKENEAISIIPAKKKTQGPNYYKVGNGTMNRHKIQSIDLLEAIFDMSKPAQRFLKMIKDGMIFNPYDERIEFIIKVKPSSPTEQNIVTRGFKELFDKDLVRKVKRSHYMINPYAMITDFDKQLVVWDTLKHHILPRRP